MSAKMANSIILIVLIGIGAWYWISAATLGTGTATNPGPGYYPRLLAVLLTVCCAIKLIHTWFRERPEKIAIPNLSILALTAGIVGLFFISWLTFGYFHIHMALFLFAMITIYRFQGVNGKVLLHNAAAALAISLMIYIIFDWLLHFQL